MMPSPLDLGGVITEIIKVAKDGCVGKVSEVFLLYFLTKGESFSSYLNWIGRKSEGIHSFL